MKQIAIIFAFIFSFSLLANAQNKKEEKAKQIKQLIENREFKFIARSATPLAGGKIDLTSTYDFTVDSMMTKAYLPFYGRAYRADYGSSNGGIKFEEHAESVDIDFNKKKKMYRVNIKVKTTKDFYQIHLDAGLSGYATLSISSNNRQSISFYGIIEPIK